MNVPHILLGVGMIASGAALIRYGLKNINIAIGVLQLVAGIILIGSGGYIAITSITC